ncbi:MAG TPA: AbrB/MazE/SpoVT family DNA-binding domain-containing protein [Candidatus Binataceae bacterium]|nr:AbrB/MazE/SpoVT family DNA-binding domain-containing protein [Candidatus Binataceae bacterium]
MAVITTKVGPKYQVTIPKAVRLALKLEAGDLLEVRVAGRGVLLKRKVLVDRDPDLEHALAEADEDLKAGRVYGPFDGAQAAIKGLRRAVKEERRRAGTGGDGKAATLKRRDAGK